MNDRKFGRFLGYGPQWPGKVPPVQVQVDAAMMMMSRPRGGSLAAQDQGSFHGLCYVVPAATLTDNYPVFQAPGPYGIVTATANITIDESYRFYPGVYDVYLNFASQTNGMGLWAQFYDANMPNGCHPILGQVNVASGTTAPQGQPIWTRMYWPDPWWIVVRNFGAWTTSNRGSICVSVSPVFVLDGNEEGR